MGRAPNVGRPADRVRAFRCLRPARKTTARSVDATGAPISTSASPIRTGCRHGTQANARTQARPPGRRGAAALMVRPHRVRRGSSADTAKRSIAERSQAPESAPRSPPSARRSGRRSAAATRATLATTAWHIRMGCRSVIAGSAKTLHKQPPEPPARSVASKAPHAAQPACSVISPQPPNAVRPTSRARVNPVPKRAQPNTSRSAAAMARRTPTRGQRRQLVCPSSTAEPVRGNRFSTPTLVAAPHLALQLPSALELPRQCPPSSEPLAPLARASSSPTAPARRWTLRSWRRW